MATFYARRRIWTFMLLLVAVYIVGSFSFLLHLFQRSSSNVASNDDVADFERRPLVVIGIFSADENFGHRSAHRRTWIGKRELHGPFRVKAYFVLNKATPSLRIEQSSNKDMIFLNISSSKSEKTFGLQLYTWYRFVSRVHPEAKLVIRMSEDVLLCAPQIFERLSRIQSSTLYYGYMHQKCINEMFLVLGMKLVQLISDRVYCGSRKQELCAMLTKEQLIERENAGISLCHWLTPYEDYETVADNLNMYHIYSTQGMGENMERQIEKTLTHNFCNRYLLFNSGKINEIYWLFKHNQPNLSNPPMTLRNSTTHVSTLNPRDNTFNGGVIRKLPEMNVRYPTDYIMKHRPIKGPHCQYWAVFYPVYTFNISVIIDLVANPVWCLVVVADAYTSDNVNLSSAFFKSQVKTEFVYLTSSSQIQLYPDFSKFIASGHVSRKNVGYLYAIEHGARFIWDVSEHFSELGFNAEKKEIDILTVCQNYKDAIINPFECYGSSLKPRGFPSSFSTSQPKPCNTRQKPNFGIIQFFDPSNPDIDLSETTMPSQAQISISKENMIPLLLPLGTLAPLNYHSTLWSSEFFKYLFLPPTVSEDVTDIWRGYIAQLLNTDYETYYMPVSSIHSTTHAILQSHSKRSNDIIQKNDLLLELFDELKDTPGLDMATVYEEMYARGYVESRDVLLHLLWRKMMIILGVT